MRLIIFRTLWQIPPEAACFGLWILNHALQDKQARRRTPAESKIPSNDSLSTGKREVTKGIKGVVNWTMYS